MGSASTRPWPWPRWLPWFDPMVPPRLRPQRYIEHYKARWARLKIGRSRCSIDPAAVPFRPPWFRQKRYSPRVGWDATSSCVEIVCFNHFSSKLVSWLDKKYRKITPILNHPSEAIRITSSLSSLLLLRYWILLHPLESCIALQQNTPIWKVKLSNIHAINISLSLHGKQLPSKGASIQENFHQRKNCIQGKQWWVKYWKHPNIFHNIQGETPPADPIYPTLSGAK